MTKNLEDGQFPACVVFVHIPKTAGQTLNAVLARQYGPSKVLTISDPDDFVTPFFRHSQRGTPRLIWGHVPFGLHTSIPITPTYITMLRKPVDRVVSTFKYIKRNPKHPLHAKVHGMTLGEFVQSDVDRRDVVNGQTRQLSGRWEPEPDVTTLAEAKQNLAESFTSVGLTERFDESLILLKQKLAWRIPLYISKNIGDRAEASEAISEEDRRLIEEHNALDTSLYEFAETLFERDVQEASVRLRLEVRLLRALNPVARVYRNRIRRPFISLGLE